MAPLTPQRDTPLLPHTRPTRQHAPGAEPQKRHCLHAEPGLAAPIWVVRTPSSHPSWGRTRPLKPFRRRPLPKVECSDRSTATEMSTTMGRICFGDAVKLSICRNDSCGVALSSREAESWYGKALLDPLMFSLARHQELV